jgi:hypothetical protein
MRRTTLHSAHSLIDHEPHARRRAWFYGLSTLSVVLAALLAVESSAEADGCRNKTPPFAWSCDGAISDMYCTQILETADPHTWSDNYFCSDQLIGMRWSSAGPISGMECTQIYEAADPDTWSDNFLCVPHDSPYNFRWSSAGPIRGFSCVQWSEPADPHTWSDNYLCW